MFLYTSQNRYPGLQLFASKCISAVNAADMPGAPHFACAFAGSFMKASKWKPYSLPALRSAACRRTVSAAANTQRGRTTMHLEYRTSKPRNAFAAPWRTLRGSTACTQKQMVVRCEADILHSKACVSTLFNHDQVKPHGRLHIQDKRERQATKCSHIAKVQLSLISASRPQSVSPLLLWTSHQLIAQQPR